MMSDLWTMAGLALSGWIHAVGRRRRGCWVPLPNMRGCGRGPGLTDPRPSRCWSPKLIDPDSEVGIKEIMSRHRDRITTNGTEVGAALTHLAKRR